MPDRSKNNYNYFVDTILLYQDIFESAVDVGDLLKLPYPLYTDIILKQIDKKKKQQSKIQREQQRIDAKMTGGNKK